MKAKAQEALLSTAVLIGSLVLLTLMVAALIIGAAASH